MISTLASPMWLQRRSASLAIIAGLVASFATFIVHTDAQNSLALANSLRQLIAQRNEPVTVGHDPPSAAAGELSIAHGLPARARMACARKGT